MKIGLKTRTTLHSGVTWLCEVRTSAGQKALKCVSFSSSDSFDGSYESSGFWRVGTSAGLIYGDGMGSYLEIIKQILGQESADNYAAGSKFWSVFG